MGYEQRYDFEAGPYCRCCGSREVMTLDVFIAEIDDWEPGSRPKDQRLWLALSDLNEYELGVFVTEVLPAAFDDDRDELACELFSQLLDASSNAPLKYWSTVRGKPLSISDVDECGAEGLTDERKRGFMRLWESFDAKTRSSFLMRVTPVGKPSGSCN